MALPKWLNEPTDLSFEHEIALLQKIIGWLVQLGWSQVPSGFDFSDRQQADLVFSREEGQKVLRMAVLPKVNESQGAVRVQAIPTFSEGVFRWKPQRQQWEIELGGVPVDRYENPDDFKWLLERLFAQ